VECKKCSQVYIGESGRTVATRINEHLGRDKSSKVYKHLLKSLSFIRSTQARRTAETLFRAKEENQFMEGCESRDILPYLLQS